jgi:cohesin complex subunit SCC1
VDFEERPVPTQSQHVARAADITLTVADDLPLDLDDPGYGFDLGPADGIGSGDFDIDLGLDFGDGTLNASVEQGRNAVEGDSHPPSDREQTPGQVWSPSRGCK